MTEPLRTGNSGNISAKMSNDLTPRKTMLILVIVVGCFAVLWPKVFYPILVGSANQHIKPSPIDKTTGCCDVISETDVHTIKIMSELCKSIIKRDEDVPLTGRELVTKCQSAVLETCGIDISAVLQEQVRLGHSVKQILDEVRSLNGSLCLKYNFGVAPWRLGVPHRITVKVSPSDSIKQERPLHLRSELVHPAFRERGRAIPQPQPQIAKPSRPSTRIVEGRPGPIPGMRPTLGGAGHVVPPPKQGTGSMGLIMPIYTIGIVIFFAYTVMKIVFKKQPEALYPPVEPDPIFRKEVFESERNYMGPKLTREGVSSKLVVNAMSALLDEVDHEIESRHKASEIAEQEDEQPSVKVLGMEMTASCEGGKKWSRPDSPVLPSSPPLLPPAEPIEPPQEIFLEGALPAQSHLLVSDSATEAQKTNSEEDPAVVLAGKMTLSVISLDSSDNGIDEISNSSRKPEERSSSNVSEEFEKIEADIHLEDQIVDIVEVQNILGSEDNSEEINLLKEIEKDIKDINTKRHIHDLDEFGKVSEIESIENKDINFVLGDINQSIINSTTESEIPEVDIENKYLEITASNGHELVQSEKEKSDQERSEQIKSIAASMITELEKDIVNQYVNDENTAEENEALFGKQIDSNLVELSNSNLSEKEMSLINEKQAENMGSIDESNTYEEVNEKSDIPLTNDEKTLETTIGNNGTKEITNLDGRDIQNEESSDEIMAPHEANIKHDLKAHTDTFNIPKTEGSNIQRIEPLEPIENISAEEKDTFVKLNEAIRDLSSDIKSKDIESKSMEKSAAEEDEEEEEDDEEEDEEVEYEYENTDDEILDDEINNIERINEISDQEHVAQLNGDDQEQSKYGTTTSATLAENDISDEEDLESEDEEEIQEIIEYVTDDEDEVEEIVQPGQQNNIDHRNE